ncbi:MAG: mannitol dehydrogenase family protein [Anaerolineae bacterium]
MVRGEVVIFGAGATGRGHLGELCHTSGYGLTFFDSDEALVAELAASGKYWVRLHGSEERQVEVQGFKAFHTTQTDELCAAVTRCQLVLTAVKGENLGALAASLAPGLAHRALVAAPGYLNVVACENMISASTALRERTFAHLSDAARGYVGLRIGFPDAMISRVVTTSPGSRLLLDGEDYNEWPVDAHRFLGQDPMITGLSLVHNLPALLERKLYMHNTGHAICAYLGFLHGHQYICDAIADPPVRQAVVGAMCESGAALIRKHGFSNENVDRYRECFLARVSGRGILDPIARVARSSLRKIGRDERLLGPACMALDYGIRPENLALGIAALLSYRSDSDPESLQLHAAVERQGVAEVLRHAASLDTQRYGSLVSQVKEAMGRLKSW